MSDSNDGAAPELRLINSIWIAYCSPETDQALDACQPESPEQKHANVWTTKSRLTVLSKSLISQVQTGSLRRNMESAQRGKKTLKNPLQRLHFKSRTEPTTGSAVASDPSPAFAKSQKRQQPVSYLLPLMFVLETNFIDHFLPTAYRCRADDTNIQLWYRLQGARKKNRQRRKLAFPQYTCLWLHVRRNVVQKMQWLRPVQHFQPTCRRTLKTPV